MTTRPSDEQLNHAFSSSHELTPTAASWGIFAYSDAPASICGSGVGMFHWFETKTEMLEFVHDYMAWYHPGPSSMQAEQIADNVQSVVGDFDASYGDLDQLRKELNEFMRGLWQIEWWGQFGDLINGLEDFPARIRSDFLGDEEGRERATTAIPEDKLDDFREFLESYGY